MNGDLDIFDMNGDLDIFDINGDLDIFDMNGDLDIFDMNGGFRHEWGSGYLRYDPWELSNSPGANEAF